MKSLFKCLAVGIAGAVLGLAQEGAAATPALAEFGYGNMTTKRAIPNAIILVNFTNNNGTTAHTVPYKMGTNLVNTNYRGAEQYYSNWFFGTTTSPETLNGYFNEISNRRFQWLPAGVYMVLMDTNDLHGAMMARAGGDGSVADTRYMTKMIQQAMDQGFNLLGYDTSHDSIVNEPECTIQLITNDKTFGGGARDLNMSLGTFAGSFHFYLGYVTIQSFDLGLRVLAEELIHVLQDGHCGDIYGPSSMSDGFSTMSGGNVLHVDAWHKLQLAWCEPRIYSMRESNQVTLPAAQLMDTNGPVILYDPVGAARGTKEFFVLEYRTANTLSRKAGYDKSVADNGLVIWHVQQSGGKDPINFTTTYYPSAEENWRRCSNCFSLFWNQGTKKPCAVDVSGHVALDGRIALACNNPAAEGVPEWRWCRKCGQLFYGPNAAVSGCAASGRHEADSRDYRLRHDDDPEALGQPGWFHCSKCQSLVKPLINQDSRPWITNWGVCTASGPHAPGAYTNSYTVLWTEGVVAMMTEGSPNLMRSRGKAWHGGDITPSLRWFDGTLSPARLVVHPFVNSANQITIEIQGYYDAWVDFAYRGTEEGSFQRPFNTFAEGVDAVFPTGPLHIKTGTSPEKGHVIKAMKIDTYGGPVTLGRP